MGTRFPSIEFMTVEAFEGGNGDLVLLQEWPALEGERYLRIMVKMSEAEALCSAIMAVAKKARKK